MVLQSKGLTAHIKRLGQGEQVLLLHGWGPNSVSLEKHLLPIAQRLSDRYELTLLDFPGHGQSEAQGADWDVAAYAAWTLELMDKLALSQPIILAHSFGGRVALYLAAHHPQRVRALVLTGCAGLRPRRTFTGWLRGRLFRLGRAGLSVLMRFPGMKERKERWLTALRAEFSSADYLATPEALRGSFSKIVREDLRGLLPQVSQATLLVWGEKDTATPLWMGQAMEKELPDARLLVYEADDHFAYLNQASRFANAVDAFLEGVAK